MPKRIFLCCSLILSISFVSAQNIVSAQPTKSRTWNNYQLGFQAPTDLVVKESSDKVFYAGNGHVFLNIYPKTGDTVNHDNLRYAVQKWGGDHKLTYTPASSISSTSGYLAANASEI